METQKSRWAVPVWVQSAETQESWWMACQSGRGQAADPRKADIPVWSWMGVQSSQLGLGPSHLFFLFDSELHWIRRGPPRKGGSLCIISLLFRPYSHPDMPRIICGQMPGYPVAQSSWHKIDHGAVVTTEGFKGDSGGVDWLPDVWPWVSYSTSLCFGFLILKTIMRAPLSVGCFKD